MRALERRESKSLQVTLQVRSWSLELQEWRLPRAHTWAPLEAAASIDGHTKVQIPPSTWDHPEGPVQPWNKASAATTLQLSTSTDHPASSQVLFPKALYRKKKRPRMQISESVFWRIWPMAVASSSGPESSLKDGILRLDHRRQVKHRQPLAWVIVRLLKLSLVMQWDAIPAEGNLLAGGVIPPDERLMGSSDLQELWNQLLLGSSANGRGWKLRVIWGHMKS